MQKERLLHLLGHDAPGVRMSYPLSVGQRALWFLYRLDPGSAAYNTVLAARVRGAVDTPALREALGELGRRHLVLSSTFSEGAAGPLQHVRARTAVALTEANGGGWSEKRLEEWLRDEARRPFDLKAGPVWRAALVRRCERESVLMLVVHHIAVDVLSYMVLVEELRALYAAARSATTATLAEPGPTYCAYVLWQAEWLRSAEAEQQWSYWRRRLSGDLPILALPTDCVPPPIQSYRGASHRFGLDPALVHALRAVVNAQRATLDLALLAGFALLLQRYTGQNEILIGSPTTGRTHAHFARVVGFFANPVVLRLTISEDTDFTSLLEHVRGVVLEARQHQGYPFALLVQRLQPRRDASRPPVFQVSFTMDKAHWAERLARSGPQDPNPGGLQLLPLPVAEQEGQFDLALQVIDQGESAFACLKYNRDLFTAHTGADRARCGGESVGGDEPRAGHARGGRAAGGDQSVLRHCSPGAVSATDGGGAGGSGRWRGGGGRSQAGAAPGAQ